MTTIADAIDQLVERAVVQSGCKRDELVISVNHRFKPYRVTAKGAKWQKDVAQADDTVIITCPTEQKFHLPL